MELDDGIMDKVLELNRKYNHIVEENEEVTRNVVWKLKNASWDNLLTMAKRTLSTLIDLMVSWVFLVRTTPVNLLLLIFFIRTL